MLVYFRSSFSFSNHSWQLHTVCRELTTFVFTRGSVKWICKLWIGFLLCKSTAMPLSSRCILTTIKRFQMRYCMNSFVCLFVCNRGDRFMCQDTLRTRKLCHSPMPGHCCNSGIFRSARPRCFPYTITWSEESTCNMGHGFRIWSTERHWEADPTTAGSRHF